MCDIFRLNFDDVIAENMQGPYSFPDLLGPWERDGLVRINQTEIKFWNGSQISLEHCGTDKVMQKHQGIGRHARAFSEATQIATDRIRWLRGWVTMPVEMQEKVPDLLGPIYPNLTRDQLRWFFPKILYLSNPIGASAGYFRRYFVNARPRYEIGKAPDEDGGFMRQYIPAKVEDNPSEDPAATRRRISGIGDQATADALLNEDWDAPVGDFFRQYDDYLHTTPPLQPPAHWFKYLSFDWGGSDPFCVLWWAVSDGEEFEDVDEKGRKRKRWFPRGALVCYREWYGCEDDDHAKGLQMRNEDIAKGIADRTLEPTSGLVLTDSLPFQDRGDSRGGKTWRMADTFADCGVPLQRANTDRVFGCAEMRARLIGKDGFPMIYFCRDCAFVREYVPAVQADKKKRECYVESGEATHAADAARYAVAARPIVKDATPKIGTLSTPAPKPILTPSRIISQLENARGQSRYNSARSSR